MESLFHLHAPLTALQWKKKYISVQLFTSAPLIATYKFFSLNHAIAYKSETERICGWVPWPEFNMIGCYATINAKGKYYIKLPGEPGHEKVKALPYTRWVGLFWSSLPHQHHGPCPFGEIPQSQTIPNPRDVLVLQKSKITG